MNEACFAQAADSKETESLGHDQNWNEFRV
jgi:hypothetical protein